MRLPQLLGIGIAALTLVLDQASKAWIGGVLGDETPPLLVLTSWLNFYLTHNQGMSFSLLADARYGMIILSVVAIAIMAGLVHLISRAPARWSGAGYGLILGGAAGNLVDRLRLGSVTDFIDAHLGTWHPFIFNVADAAITVGVGCLLLDGLLRSGEGPT